MTHISFSSLFRKNNMGGKTDWVGKKLTSQIFPRGKKLTGEKTDRYTGSPTVQKTIRNYQKLKNPTMRFFISMTSDLIIIDQTSFPYERATVIDYFPLHKTPVAADPSLSSLVHTWPHGPN